ncbi:XrtA system polysaccharide deacetylase [Halobacillus campisalis]|uniref:XrtA system polysaccharide deacetylase n=1 Tax=Halobacillus campisalis TaxID=435909 RepID=A0ABW2JZW7_9BACI|nr:XrtA system polysaccharide deacetylase [Halobacillus campisalis]
MKDIMISFDIEDYFHVETFKHIVNKGDWESLEHRVEGSTEKILELMENANAKGTFFVLGWVAEKFPELVKKIHLNGHEIASHGYNHDLVYNISENEFREDLRKSKKLLEDLTGEEIIGYRAPTFSITEDGLDILKEEGFKYDSSINMLNYHDKYSNIDNEENQIIETLANGLIEVKIPVMKSVVSLPWGGGGYFRLIPYPLYRNGVKKILKQHNTFCFYLHPWELDYNQPKFENINRFEKFRHYYGLKQTEKKLKKLVNDFEACTIKTFLNNTNNHLV